MDQVQNEFREWLCRGQKEEAGRRLCLEITEETGAEAADGSRTIVLQLSAKGMPVYCTQQKIAAGKRLEEAWLWRRLAEELALDWELPGEAKKRLLEADFYF